MAHLIARHTCRHCCLQLRNTLEYGGGWTDTYLHPAKSGVDTWNVITKGSSRYRVDPGSQPQPRIPFSRKSQYQITYYNRDVRRNPTGNFAIEDSFGEEGKKLLFAPALAGVDPGSRGQKVCTSLPSSWSRLAALESVVRWFSAASASSHVYCVALLCPPRHTPAEPRRPPLRPDWSADSHDRILGRHEQVAARQQAKPLASAGSPAVGACRPTSRARPSCTRGTGAGQTQPDQIHAED